MSNEFRDYNESSSQVKKFYMNQHLNLTYVKAVQMNMQFMDKQKQYYTINQLLRICDDIYDPSDPDTNLSQTEHAYQTANYALEYGLPDEYVVMGMIHDLGKVVVKLLNYDMLYIVGDTYPLGCPFETDKITLGESLLSNPDQKNPIYSNGHGVYQPNCGFSNMVFTGHDEFIYISLCHTQHNLPDWALYVLRFHSFYPWHSNNAYVRYANKTDIQYLQCLKTFNKCDLYTKHDKIVTQKQKEKINKIVDQYLPHGLKF